MTDAKRPTNWEAWQYYQIGDAVCFGRHTYYCSRNISAGVQPHLDPDVWVLDSQYAYGERVEQDTSSLDVIYDPTYDIKCLSIEMTNRTLSERERVAGNFLRGIVARELAKQKQILEGGKND